MKPAQASLQWSLHSDHGTKWYQSYASPRVSLWWNKNGCFLLSHPILFPYPSPLQPHPPTPYLLIHAQTTACTKGPQAWALGETFPPQLVHGNHALTWSAFSCSLAATDGWEQPLLLCCEALSKKKEVSLLLWCWSSKTPNRVTGKQTLNHWRGYPQPLRGMLCQIPEVLSGKRHISQGGSLI